MTHRHPFIHMLALFALMLLSGTACRAQRPAPTASHSTELHPQRSFALPHGPQMKKLQRGGPPTRQMPLPNPNNPHFHALNQKRFFPIPKAVSGAATPAAAQPSAQPSATGEDPLDLLLPKKEK